MRGKIEIMDFILDFKNYGNPSSSVITVTDYGLHDRDTGVRLLSRGR